MNKGNFLQTLLAIFGICVLGGIYLAFNKTGILSIVGIIVFLISILGLNKIIKEIEK